MHNQDTPEEVLLRRMQIAQRLAAQERQQREQACLDALHRLLTRYRCELRTQLLIDGGQITPHVRVVSQQ